MSDLVEFLRARLDEDEKIAHGARGRTWTSDDLTAGITEFHSGTFEHIARHDPARVLLDVESKRRIVELHKSVPDPAPPFRDEAGFLCAVCTSGGIAYDHQRGVPLTDLTVFPCTTLRLLALPYAEHPEYRAEWRPW